jgi:ribosomal protein L7/L12
MEWQMSSIIIGALLFVSGYTLGRVSKTLEVARESRARWTPDPKINDADIEEAIRAKNTIQAIKLYRQRTGAGLREAKQAVEALAQRINVRR